MKIEQNEVLKDEIKNEVKEAQEWAFSNLLGEKIFHSDINAFIEFNRKGIKHAIYGKTYYLKPLIIYDIKELLTTSTLFSIEKDKLGRPDINRVFKFVNTWEYLKKEYFIYMIVRETKEGSFYYDHGIIKEKSLV